MIVPGLLPAPIVEKSIPVQRDFEVRAVYLTGIMAASDHGIRIIRHWREAGGNAVVFDIKDSDGSVTIPFDHPLLGVIMPASMTCPSSFTSCMRRTCTPSLAWQFSATSDLVETHPELAVKSHKTGQAWRENGKLVWTDPSQPKVQEYDIALAKKAAEAGADEIQFDYVRFPAEGDQKDASFVVSDRASRLAPLGRDRRLPETCLRRTSSHGRAVVARCLRHHGLAAPGRPGTYRTGHLRMAKYCDVLSPMIYPSHFFGMDGIAHPGDAPEHFIGESMARFEKITQGSGVVIRPWLQAFRWRTKTYSPKYIEAQVITAKNKGGIGFLFWNAANDYSKPYAAMPEMIAAKGQYFRGDELPGGARVSLPPAAGSETAMAPVKP